MAVDRTPLEPTVQVTDVRALRALAHPLRNRMLGRLRVHGPATASALAREVGESSGSTSYHLRQLASYGFVEEIEGRGTARERWWRARHRMTSWQAADLVAQEGGAEVQAEISRMQIDQHARVLEAWHEQKEALGPAWAAAASLNDYGLRLRPHQAQQLMAELNALLQRWAAAHPTDVAEHPGDTAQHPGDTAQHPGDAAQHPGDTAGDDAELVVVLADVVPLREMPS